MRDAKLAQARDVLAYLVGGSHQRAASFRIWLIEHDRERTQYHFHFSPPGAASRLAKLIDHLSEPFKARYSCGIPTIAELHRAIECVLPEPCEIDRRMRLLNGLRSNF